MTTAPLDGCCVLLTRPEGQSRALTEAIEEAGGSVIRFPVIRIVPRGVGEIEDELGAVAPPDIIIFVSRNAVSCGLEHVRGLGAAIGAVGPSTAAAIEAAGVSVDILPAETFDSEHLLETPGLKDVDGKRILIVRGESGRELLADTLRERGATVSYLPVYQRKANVLPAEAVERVAMELAAARVDCIAVMSVQTLECLLELLPASAGAALRKTPLVAPGDRVIQTASELVPGMPAIRAAGPRAADIVNALIDWRQSGQTE